MAQKKVLLLGLDGATFDLIKPWADAGVLPTFARLLRTGAHGRVRTVPNTDTAPAWTTLATGLNPANHGLYHEFSWTPDRRTLHPVCGGEREGTSFWRLASDAGRSVVVINFPFSYPAEPINGVMVAGVDAPSEEAPDFCYPPDFIENLGKEGHTYRINSDIQSAIKENRPDEGLSSAYTVATSHIEALFYALSQQPWELAVVALSIPDEMQHFFWQQMVKDRGPQRDAIRDGYRFVEQQIERLLDFIDDETTLLIVSDHGFGPICATPPHLAQWLAQEGFLRYIEPTERPWKQRLISACYDWMRHTLSEQQKMALRRWLPGVRNRVETDARFAGIDWAATTAFVAASSWEIWINTQGREPSGSVAPGIEYEEVREAIIAALLAWRRNEQPVVRAAYRREEVYHGKYLALAPDITIEWNPEVAPPAETLLGNMSQFDADHQPEGILLAVGPTIKAGKSIQTARLADLAPTILHLLGVPVPKEIDGQVLSELLI